MDKVLKIIKDVLFMLVLAGVGISTGACFAYVIMILLVVDR